MDNIFEQSLEFHERNKGKIEVRSKVPLDNKEALSLAYTPGVAEVSKRIAMNPEDAYRYTLKQNSIAVVSDGSAVLGLGNLGAKAAIPVMEGKAAIFKEFAGIDAFPICLDTQDTEKIIKTIKMISPVFGGINLEDISAPRCFEIERRLAEELDIPVMHDDQHGTATVVLAGLINSLKLRGTKKEDATVLINGVGAAGSAIAYILALYGFKNILLCDTHGLIYEGRDNLSDEKIKLSQITNKEKIKGSLEDGLKFSDIFIGVSKAGLLNADHIKMMKEQPIIFALANPTPEIMPDIAKGAGAFIYASGRSDFPNQVNNALVFPGIFRGLLDKRIKKINNEIFIKAAEALAGHNKNLSVDQILPDLYDKSIVDSIKNSF